MIKKLEGKNDLKNLQILLSVKKYLKKYALAPM